MKKTKKENTLYTLLGKIGDILLVPVFIVSLLVSTFILFQNKGDTVPSVFGVSIVKVLSGSMRKSGFQIGDKVFVQKVDTKTLWGSYEGGDIIAFFSCEDAVDKPLVKTKLDSVDQELEVTKDITGRRSLQEVQGKGYKVIFHQIVGVYQDETGARYFKTRGTSNGSDDAILIRQDFVLGKYMNTPEWIRSALSWISSSAGMITLVCVPLGIMVIFQGLALIEQINFMYVERRLVRGAMHWQDYEAKRLIKTGDMEETCKIIYYTKVEEEEREELLAALWLFPEKPNKEQQRKKEIVEKGVDIFEKQGTVPYLNYWVDNLKWGWDKKKIKEEINAINNEQLFDDLNEENKNDE